MASKRRQRRAEERQRAEFQARKCEGKIRYPNFATALRAAEEVARRRGDYLHPYQCPCCSVDLNPGWHLGHPRVFGVNRLK